MIEEMLVFLVMLSCLSAFYTRQFRIYLGTLWYKLNNVTYALIIATVWFNTLSFYPNTLFIIIKLLQFKLRFVIVL